MHRTLRLAIVLVLVTTAFSSLRTVQPWFEEIAAGESGIAWVHRNAMSEDRHLPETVGPGVALFDFDNDGLPDIYFLNSGPADFFRPAAPLRNALYRNKGDGTFEDLTEGSGLESTGFGMGAAAADYDRDGWQDLLITTYDGAFLFRNNGDGTFTDVSAKAGIRAPGWSTSAAWFDYNNDGALDLFIASFVRYTPEENRFCGDPTAVRQHYCIPRVFQPRPSYLFRNNGNGTFTDVSKETGIAAVPGKSFGVVATDVNNDGYLDLFVANDTMPNFLFVNEGGKRFSEVGLLAGVAYSEEGKPRSGMGVDAVDYDGDGWQDLFVANIDKEMFSLYRNQEGQDFVDASPEIRRDTRHLSGWGLRFFDYDNDGDPDLFLANGHPDDRIALINPMVTYRMELMLFENVGGAYRNVSTQAGSIFRRKMSARGLAVGDLDNDGDLDIVIANNGEPPVLLRNTVGSRKRWIGLVLKPVQSNSAAVGAVIRWRAGDMAHARLKTGGGSYLSSHDPREILGLGQAAAADEIEIRWPSGIVDRLENVSAGRYLHVIEGKGIQK